MRDRWIRTIAASLVVGAAGKAVFWGATDGFRALTSEQARRVAVERAPRTLPDVMLEDQDGRTFSLASYRGRPVVVDFVYTQCVSVCPLLSAGFQKLDRDRGHPERNGHPERSEGSAVGLLSISFDPRDTPQRLREYRKGWGAGDGWRFARVKDTARLGELLRAFEVVVIPDGRGDFQHNAAVHVVNADGRLARILGVGVTSADVAAALRQ